MPSGRGARIGLAVRSARLRWYTLVRTGSVLAPLSATTVGRFRIMARREVFARFGAGRLPIQIAASIAWTIGAFYDCARAVVRRRPGAAPGIAGFLRMYRVALAHNISVGEYRRYQLDRPEHRDAMGDYVCWTDRAAIVGLSARRGADVEDVHDKHRFAQVCGAHGLACVPTLAVFEGGRQVFPAEAFSPDAPRLWEKALRLSGGAGARRWIKNGDVFHASDDSAVPASKLAEVLRLRDCIVQPVIENHSALAGLGSGALASVRIITGMDDQGAAHAVAAYISPPHGASLTSMNDVARGVDLATGLVNKPLRSAPTPLAGALKSGHALDGLQLPDWPEALELVRRAHAVAFSRFAFLGWDVALTPTGPLLLETNLGWHIVTLQALVGPLGRTVFSALLEQYL